MKIIFLDIDGVLSPFNPNPEIGCAEIDRGCVRALNHIIYKTEAAIVISSSWKWLIVNGSMTILGFTFMLRSHGLTSLAKVIGHTPTDDEVPEGGRPAKIARWLSTFTEPVERFVILDDMAIEGFDGKCVRTIANVGLRRSHADKAIRILNE